MITTFVKALQVRLLWPVLVLLASFVIFFEFVADVGGSTPPHPSPAQPTAVASPVPTVTPAP